MLMSSPRGGGVETTPFEWMDLATRKTRVLQPAATYRGLCEEERLGGIPIGIWGNAPQFGQAAGWYTRQHVRPVHPHNVRKQTCGAL